MTHISQFLARIFIGHTTPHVSLAMSHPAISLIFHSDIDYEQQRKDLMRKYGIDLEDGEASGRVTRRLSRKQVSDIMGPQEDSGEGGNIFTWRDQNRRKVRASSLNAKWHR